MFKVKTVSADGQSINTTTYSQIPSGSFEDFLKEHFKSVLCRPLPPPENVVNVYNYETLLLNSNAKPLLREKFPFQGQIPITTILLREERKVLPFLSATSIATSAMGKK